MRKLLTAVGIAALTVALMGAKGDGNGGCSPGTTPVGNAESQSQQLAAQVDATTTENNEADNIAFKRNTMGKPGLVGYVVFLSWDGRPIQYYAVKGKCTSGSKRLTQARREEWLPAIRARDPNATDNWGGWHEVDGPGEDGTYGPSDNYIYCHTTSDAYVQWNGNYLYSTQPFDLTIKPLVVEVSGKEQGQ